MTPLYIFDLDGTLADIRHRRPFVEGKKKDWPAFFAACVYDRPIEPIISIYRALRQQGAETWIWSGRSNEVAAETAAWFADNNIKADLVRMRKQGDYTPDDALKRDWYDRMSDFDRSRLVAVFDDRDRLVKMWRSVGVVCLQVADGDF